MNEDRPWEGEEPSARADPTFSPVPAALGVFLAVAGPVVFVAVSRPEGTNRILLGIGLIAGLLVAVGVGMWLARRGGRVQDRPPL